MRLRTLLLPMLIAAAAGGLGYAYVTGYFAPDVTTAKVTRGRAAEVVYATGIVEPERWAKVVALSRKRLVYICDCEGQKVKAGDVIARLDDAEERAFLAELQARRQRLAQDVERTRMLVARNAATQTALDQTMTQLQEFEARIVAQTERISDLQLRAPMDGVVLRKDGEVGEIAGIGTSDVLFWVGQPKPLRIVADVNEEDIPRVRTGQAVLVRSEGFKDQPLAAQVGDMTPKGDPATKTFRVYLTLPDDTPLRIGMSIEANIVTREKDNVLLVPTEAVQGSDVFRVNGDRLHRVTVKTGIRGTRALEVEQGVAEGDIIASPLQSSFTDGMRIHLKSSGNGS
ncbi:MAG: efflux transporter periplasmic adaptor subunit [Hyphomicrobiales bacterium]|nr:efflux transporter periplasmic adaptor subunit [Hyphomicrobiales bacterium]